MTVADCRTILKVHIMAADSCGKSSEALALIAALDAIDADIASRSAPTVSEVVGVLEDTENRAYPGFCLRNGHSAGRSDPNFPVFRSQTTPNNPPLTGGVQK